MTDTTRNGPGHPGWNRGSKLPPEPLSPAEVRALIQAAGGNSSTSIRNQALLVTLWRAGLRISEALDLRVKDLNPGAGTITVLNGKGSRTRTVGMDPTGFAVLSRWMDRRRSLGLNGKQTLFCTLQGGRLSAQYVRAAMKRYAAAAGIEKRVHPHGLRHTLAVEMLKEDANVVEIQHQLGHTSLNTTAVYLQALANQGAVEFMQGREWSL